jgi:hypothetical protein
MDRIRLIARVPLNNGTWLHLRDGRWGSVDLRLIPQHLVEEADLRFHQLAAFQPVPVPDLASMYMALPRYLEIDGVPV